MYKKTTEEFEKVDASVAFKKMFQEYTEKYGYDVTRALATQMKNMSKIFFDQTPPQCTFCSETANYVEYQLKDMTGEHMVTYCPEHCRQILTSDDGYTKAQIDILTSSKYVENIMEPGHSRHFEQKSELN